MNLLRRSLQWGDLGRLLLSWLAAALALTIAVAIVPGMRVENPWWLLLAAAAVGVTGAVIRPVLVAVAARMGWAAVLLLAVFGQAIVVHLALLVIPGVTGDSFAADLAVSWIAAAVGTLLAWLATAGTDEAFTATLIRRGHRTRATVADPEVEGIVFVQLDGVAFPVLNWALQAGSLPTVRRWMQAGSHQLHEWRPRLPPTTPASQIGILHGRADLVPAFRWYDRVLGRVLVANHPKDAAEIEHRATDGNGLLADGGVSVSNIFSGDAPRTAMVMSRLSRSSGSPETRRATAWYLARPDGFARSLTRMVVEITRERFQAVRQRRRDVQPRVPRNWVFAGMRAVSNGVLRDLNTAIVAQEMLRGTRSVYVDYVDYDEVAHHAGTFRPEALAVLEALDAVLHSLEQVAAVAPRRYRIVVLSDHGQSQGETFADRYGISLAGLCAQLAGEQVCAVEKSVEGWGRIRALFDDLAGGVGFAAKTVRRAAEHVRRRADAATPAVRPDSGDLVVLASGNLGLVFAPGTQRLSMEEITARWPELVPGLVAHEGIGFVVVRSADQGLLAIGRQGVHRLDDGTVTGEDPLLPFGPLAAEDVRRAASMSEAPDIYVNSAVDPATLEVAAFEELVGCHGGLGGYQDRAVLLAPADLPPPEQPVVGADVLHRLLVSWLEHVGQRKPVARPDTEHDTQSPAAPGTGR